jgi:hypothetical protein
MPVNRDEVIQAQKAWGDGIVAIGTAFTQGRDYVQCAREHIIKLYAYDLGTVLFKPTQASQRQFRHTVEEAESYFVGKNGVCPEDRGFALRPWTRVRFENEGMLFHGDIALCMGNYFFTDTQGQETKVEYTFGYVKTLDGAIKIDLHHSSLPYSPPND